MEEIVQRGRKGGPPFDMALMALTGLLEESGGISYDLRAELYEAARVSGCTALAELLLTEPATLGPEPAVERALAVGERPLPLGQRKALARGPRGPLLDRLLRDTHPQVIRNLLDNPRVTERDVLCIATLRPQNTDNLREVFRSKRWIVRSAVRRALVWNPHTPGEIAKRLVPLLSETDLWDVRRDETMRPSLRRMAKALLSDAL